MVDTRRLAGLASRLEAKLRLPDGHLVVGLSGGADSGALAYLLSRGGQPVRAIHVHHGLAASERLESAAMSIASSLRLEIDVIRVSIPPGASPEGQARSGEISSLPGIGPGRGCARGAHPRRPGRDRR